MLGKIKSVFGAVICVSIVCIGWLQFEDRSLLMKRISRLESVRQNEPVSSRSEVASDSVERARVANMAARLTALELSAALPALSATEQAAAPPQRAEQAVVAPEERTRRDEALARAQLAACEAGLKDQPVDRNAEAQFGRIVENVLGVPELAGVKRESVKCSAKLCRLDVSTSGDLMHDAGLMLNRLDRAGPHGAMWMNTALGGADRAIVFAAAYGADLPMAPPISDTQ